MQHVFAHITEILILLFLAIVFLQSGIDKVVDWQGNVSWLKEHFSKTFLSGTVPMMVLVITIVELLAGGLSLAGVFQLSMSGTKTLGLYGAAAAALALIMLIFGQRIAKDYEGAKTIAVYFITAIFGVWLLA